jgi:hypothetical protein
MTITVTITGDKAEYEQYLIAKKKEGRELSATEQQWLRQPFYAPTPILIIE